MSIGFLDISVVDIRLWLLVGISLTLFVAFVVVTVLVLLDLVGVVKLPPDVAKPLRTTLIIEFAVIAVGAVGALLVPNQIQQQVYDLLQSTRAISAANSEESDPAEPVEPELASAEVVCANANRPPLIYIQFGTEAQRATATAVQAGAQSQGWLAPGIELVPAYTRLETQLRYFDQAEHQDAQVVASQLVELGLLPQDTQVVAVDANVSACQFEVWLGSAAG